MTEADERNPPKNQPCDEPAAIRAFTGWTLLTAFLSDREAGKWELSLIPDGDALFLALADLHYLGVEHVCFDPKPDGSEGKLIPLTDMLGWAMDGRSKARDADGPDLLL